MKPMTDLDDEPERDHWQEYKDDLAMGYIHEDGTQQDQDPTDYLGDPDDEGGD